jgi:hypothetical protein
MIASDLLTALDPVMLARLAGIVPDDWQTDLLRSTAPRMLVNVTRQGGKSTMTAVLAVHLATYQPGSLILLLSPGMRQSTELLRKVVDVYRALDRPVPASAETLLRLELENGSRIIALPGSEATVRGYSAPALVIVDEASRVEDDLIAATTPMQATAPGSRLLALSTPAGRRGWWWKAWQDGGNDWSRVLIRATDVPRIGRDFLERERRTMPSSRFRQEYECGFEEADAAVFAADAVSQAIDHEREPLALDVFRRWRTA